MPEPITKMIRCTIISSGLNIWVRFNRCHHCKRWFQAARPEALYCPKSVRPCKARAQTRRRAEAGRTKR